MKPLSFFYSRRYHGLFLICLVFTLFPAGVFGQQSPFIISSPDADPKENTTEPVHIHVSLSKNRISPGETLSIDIEFVIPEGQMLYAEETGITMENAPFFQAGHAGFSGAVTKNVPEGQDKKVFVGKAGASLPVQIMENAAPGEHNLTLHVKYRACTENKCLFPENKTISKTITIVPSSAIQPGTQPKDNQDIPRDEDAGAVSGVAERFGIIGVVIAAFFWGILASLTPCIYPMIPITVSVIGGGASGSIKKGFFLSLLYVFGMSLTYAGFGVAAALTGSLFGEYANAPAVRILVAIILCVMALSMFDLFSVQMPSGVASKLSAVNMSGYTGVFITGLASGMVVGPCVGPLIVGLLVYISTLGSLIKGFFIMWGFALGMGLLLLVVGTFSGAASSLPKAGPWMEKIKTFFGLILLAFALYYIRPVIQENLFYLILGAFLVITGIFLGAFDPVPKESGSLPFFRIRKGMGIIAVALGITYAVLFATHGKTNLSAGFPRPSPITTANWITNEKQGFVLASKENKPVLIDFTASWCHICKKLDQKTFSHPKFLEKAEQFVLIRVDCTDTDDPNVIYMKNKYRILGLPTILFTDHSGKNLLPPLTEFAGPDTILTMMEQARRRFVHQKT